MLTANVPFQGNDIETLKRNILKLKIAWPIDINLDAKNLIMKTLKLYPNERISLSDMLVHPFITKYFPNATQSLIKPDTRKNKTFVVSKDDPKFWEPYPKESQKENAPKENKPTKQSDPCPKEKSRSPPKVPTDNSKKEKEKKVEKEEKEIFCRG